MEKNKVGRPRMFKDPSEIQVKWNEYIQYCKDFTITLLNNKGGVTEVPKPRIPTLGEFISEWLDSHTATWDLYRDREEFIETIKKIEDIVKSKKVASLVNGEGNTTGLIFDLKVNYGMNEKTVIDANITGLPVNIITTNTPPLANDDK